jgi:hypothetical protein
MENEVKYNSTNEKNMEKPETLTVKITELEKLADNMSYGVNASREILVSIKGQEANVFKPEDNMEKELEPSGILEVMADIINKMAKRIAETNRALDEIRTSLY